MTFYSKVTNNQYTEFLNSVATGISPVGLYKAEMSSNNAGGITRTGDGSSTPYGYSVKSGMGYMPVVFVDYFDDVESVSKTKSTFLLFSVLSNVLR